MEKITKTPAEWKAQLDKTQYHVTREHGTERDEGAGQHAEGDQPSHRSTGFGDAHLFGLGRHVGGEQCVEQGVGAGHACTVDRRGC